MYAGYTWKCIHLAFSRLLNYLGNEQGSWIASIIGLVLISWVLLKNATKVNDGFVVTAFAMVLVGEFLGRFIFYSIGVKIMIG